MVRLCNRASPTGLFGTKLQWGVVLQPQYWQHNRHKLCRLIDIHGAFSGIPLPSLKFQIL
jgi:hypothetical protein